ncbi:MAG: energy-coupling factor ABC transporter permease [Betaproteobacteria bacterium]|nr:energy-coupling factor ABC transporter permease [Betaproteobacteria bacterium]
MDFLGTPLPAGWAITTGIVAAVLLARAARRAPWHLLADGFRLHGWIGAAFAIALAWSLCARLGGGPAVHLLATPLVALMFGRDLAAVAGAPAVFAVLLWRGGDWAGAGATWLLAAWLPVTILDALRLAADRWLPRNVFTYIFLAGFFAPGATFVATVAMAAAAHYAVGTAAWDSLAAGFLPYGLLLGWAEAFLSGILTAIFVVYEPRWMVTFDDARYLRPPGDPG